MIIKIIIVIIFLFISALVSAAEAAILSASDAKIQKLKMEGNKRALTLKKLRKRQERLIGAILLVASFVNIASSTMAASISIDLLGESGSSIAIATAVMTLLIIIYCEVLPKTYAVRNAEHVALMLTPFCNFIVKLFTPVLYVIQFIVNKTINLLTFKGNESDKLSGLEVIRGAIELHHEEGHVRHEEKYMLGTIIDLGEIPVGDIMVHRNDIKSINIDDNIEKNIAFIINSAYSRVPIWKTKPDNIIGLVYVKDLVNLLYSNGGKPLDKEDLIKIARKPQFIPESTSLKNQLKAFQAQHHHIAMVVDEYGELMGLITLEDIMEEIVGHIEDEHDLTHSFKLIKHNEKSATISGDMTIRDINRAMHWKISDKDAATIGGLLMHLAKGIPSITKTYKYGDYKLKLVKRKKNKILKVNVFIAK